MVLKWSLCSQGPDGEDGKPGTPGTAGLPGADVSYTEYTHLQQFIIHTPQAGNLSTKSDNRLH